MVEPRPIGNASRAGHGISDKAECKLAKKPVNSGFLNAHVHLYQILTGIDLWNVDGLGYAILGKEP